MLRCWLSLTLVFQSLTSSFLHFVSDGRFEPSSNQAASDEVPSPPAAFRGVGPKATGQACASANVRPSPNMFER